MEIELDIQLPKCHGEEGSATAYAIGGSGSYSFSWFSACAGFPTVVPHSTPDAIFLDAPADPALTIENAEIICHGTGSHLNLDYSPSHSGYCSLSLFSNNASSSRLGDCDHCFAPERVHNLLFNFSFVT